jgi:hypothetical protein
MGYLGGDTERAHLGRQTNRHGGGSGCPATILRAARPTKWPVIRQMMGGHAAAKTGGHNKGGTGGRTQRGSSREERHDAR